MLRTKCGSVDILSGRTGTFGRCAQDDTGSKGHPAGVVNPGFGGDELEGEAEPEGGTEEVVRGEMREAAGGEEDADDVAPGTRLD